MLFCLFASLDIIDKTGTVLCDSSFNKANSESSPFEFPEERK